MQPKGNPNSKIWCVIEKPYDKDTEKGYIFSSSYGYVWDKLWRESGIRESPYICDMSSDFGAVLNEICLWKPPIICPIGKKKKKLFFFIYSTRSRNRKKKK